MVLRRLIQHIKTQNWFAVGLDLLVVIVGIFLGLRFTELNEDRKDTQDSYAYLQRIHDELAVSIEASDRVRTRRLQTIEPLVDAGRVIFSAEENVQLEYEHCFTLGVSHFYNISVPELPSLAELMSAGRVHIIRDVKLRTALIKLQQTYGVLQTVIEQYTPAAHNLPAMHPQLIASAPYFDNALGEMQSSYRCDLSGMRSNQEFLNQLSENIDAYDAYLRDGLLPWNDQISSTHQQLDDYLNLVHTESKDK